MPRSLIPVGLENCTIRPFFFKYWNSHWYIPWKNKSFKCFSSSFTKHSASLFSLVLDTAKWKVYPSGKWTQDLWIVVGECSQSRSQFIPSSIIHSINGRPIHNNHHFFSAYIYRNFTARYHLYLTGILQIYRNTFLQSLEVLIRQSNSASEIIGFLLNQWNTKRALMIGITFLYRPSCNWHCSGSDLMCS